MIQACLRPSGEELKLDPSADEIRRTVAGGDGLLWVDIETSERDPAAESLLRDVFGFHQLTIDDCFNHFIDPPKIDDYGTYLFVIVHDVEYEKAARHLSVVELDMYIGANYVVTFHREPVTAVDAVRRRASQNGLPLSRRADFLAHAIFDEVVDGFHPVAEAIDEQVSNVEDAVLARPQRETLEEVLALKRAAQRLKRTALPQRDVANRFSRGEYEQLIHAESRMYFRDVYDHIVRVEEMIDSVRDLADSTLNTYLSSVNNRTNDVMRTLAIVSVIFLPLTLIASVYGTNFETTWPDYSWAPGFFLMVGSFAAIIVVGFVLARWRGWMK